MSNDAVIRHGDGNVSNVRPLRVVINGTFGQRGVAGFLWIEGVVQEEQGENF